MKGKKRHNAISLRVLAYPTLALSQLWSGISIKEVCYFLLSVSDDGTILIKLILLGTGDKQE